MSDKISFGIHLNTTRNQLSDKEYFFKNHIKQHDTTNLRNLKKYVDLYAHAVMFGCIRKAHNCDKVNDNFAYCTQTCTTKL